MELIFELFAHALHGFAQLCATALWETKDPAIIAKRNVCLSIYGIAFLFFAASCGMLVFRAISLFPFLLCLGLTTILLLLAGYLADDVEKQVLEQQKTPGPKTEG